VSSADARSPQLAYREIPQCIGGEQRHELCGAPELCKSGSHIRFGSTDMGREQMTSGERCSHHWIKAQKDFTEAVDRAWAGEIHRAFSRPLPGGSQTVRLQWSCIL
jgi:hypothetical protein